MKPIKESLFVGSRLVCTKLSIWHNNGEATIYNIAYCCPACGEVWGRRIYQAEEIRWRFHERPCEQHGDGSLIFSELEFDHMLQPPIHAADEAALEVHYPIQWLAYELFLIVRRYP